MDEEGQVKLGGRGGTDDEGEKGMGEEGCRINSSQCFISM